MSVLKTDGEEQCVKQVLRLDKVTAVRLTPVIVKLMILLLQW